MLYQIIRITDSQGVSRNTAEDRERLGCIGSAKMDNGCVLMHLCRDGLGQPLNRYLRTSLMQSWDKDASTGRITVVTMNSVYHLSPMRE